MDGACFGILNQCGDTKSENQNGPDKIATAVSMGNKLNNLVRLYGWIDRTDIR
jgi:hypothetical protein